MNSTGWLSRLSKYLQCQTTDVNGRTDCFQSGTANRHIWNPFCNLIKVAYEMDQPIWPPGFQAMRTIVVGLSSLKTGVAVGKKSPLHPLVVAPLFLLPNVVSIYIAGLKHDDDDDDDELGEDSAITLRPGSSSVQHLGFEDASPWHVKHAITKFIDSSRNLKSIVFQDCNFDDFDTTIDDLADSQGDSLETLIYCGDLTQLRGYRCSKFLPEHLSGFKKLRTVTIDGWDIKLGSSWNLESKLRDGKCAKSAAHDHFAEYFRSAIPETTETLIMTVAYWRVLNEKHARSVDDVLARLIEAGSHPRLKEVHLEAAVNAAEIDVSKDSLDSPRKLWFRHAAEVGKAHGVTVHTAEGSTEAYTKSVCQKLFDLTLVDVEKRGD
jgi:hypothetical protein